LRISFGAIYGAAHAAGVVHQKYNVGSAGTRVRNRLSQGGFEDTKERHQQTESAYPSHRSTHPAGVSKLEV